MNREEILNAAKNENKNMDELQQNNYRNAYAAGGLAAVLLAVVYQIYECVTMGNWFGYMSILFIQLGISGLVFGIKARESKFGKLYIISGSLCLLTSVLATVVFFMRELL